MPRDAPGFWFFVLLPFTRVTPFMIPLPRPGAFENGPSQIVPEIAPTYQVCTGPIHCGTATLPQLPTIAPTSLS